MRPYRPFIWAALVPADTTDAAGAANEAITAFVSTGLMPHYGAVQALGSVWIWRYPEVSRHRSCSGGTGPENPRVRASWGMVECQARPHRNGGQTIKPLAKTIEDQPETSVSDMLPEEAAGLCRLSEQERGEEN